MGRAHQQTAHTSGSTRRDSETQNVPPPTFDGALAGPSPYRWYALVDPVTLEHDDSFERAQSALAINNEHHRGRMLIVGMGDAYDSESRGHINPRGHVIDPASITAD